jgi:hypothetical protein
MADYFEGKRPPFAFHSEQMPQMGLGGGSCQAL